MKGAGVEDPWCLVREAGGAAYAMSQPTLDRCREHPPPRHVVARVLEVVAEYNDSGETPGVVTEAESLFLHLQIHGWASEDQAYIVLADGRL